MATAKRKSAPAKGRSRAIPLKTSRATRIDKGIIGDVVRATDAELAEALKVTAKAYNAALLAVKKAGLSVVAYVDNIFEGGDAAQTKPVAPPAITLVAIDRRHLG